MGKRKRSASADNKRMHGRCDGVATRRRRADNLGNENSVAVDNGRHDGDQVEPEVHRRRSHNGRSSPTRNTTRRVLINPVIRTGDNNNAQPLVENHVYHDDDDVVELHSYGNLDLDLVTNHVDNVEITVDRTEPESEYNSISDSEVDVDRGDNTTEQVDSEIVFNRKGDTATRREETIPDFSQ